MAGRHPHPSHSNEDGPAASSKPLCVSSLWSFGSACFIADGGRLRLYTPMQVFQNCMETLRNHHEAYGLTEKRLGEIYKCKVRAITCQRLKLWSKEAAILESGKMKSPKGHRERRPPARESMVPLQRKPWRIQGYPQKGREV